jgi:hypothetical protein
MLLQIGQIRSTIYARKVVVMKKIVCLLLSIITFILCLPFSFFVSLFFIGYYNSIGLDNGIFQLIVVVILCISLSFQCAKMVYGKLNKLTQNSSDKTSLSE